MRKVFFTIFLSFIVFYLYPASYIITGKVIDESSRLPVDFANVTLYEQGNESPIQGIVSDSNGDFQLASVPEGIYNLQITFIGYNIYSRNIELKSDIRLGNISLKEDAQALNELEVVGMGSQMRFEIDRKVFSVDQNIASAGGSATEVLENIPSVEVDQEGNISLRNNESVEVWINGKPSGLTAENRAQILQQMPAESIESIEVITNPSAKFSPEGTAGIINIVLKKNRQMGYQGSVTGGLIYPDGGKIGGNIGGNINFSNSKIDAYLNFGYRQMKRNGGSLTDLWNYNINDTILLHRDNKNNASHGGIFIRTGFDYHINDRNTIGISGFGMNGGGNENSRLFYSEKYENTDLLKRVYSRENSGESDRANFNVTLDYKHEFKKQGSQLLGSISYSEHKRDNEDSYLQTDSFPDTRKSYIVQNSNGKNTQTQFKLDYTNKLTRTGRLEAGWQSDFQKRNSYSDAFDGTNNTELYGYYNEFDYKEQIHAAYITYGDRFFEKLSLQIGIRGEYMIRDAEYTDADVYKESIDYNSYFELFPSAYLGYAISPTDEIQLNYTRRVQRPRGWQINPFRDYSDSTSISFGNINLNPEFSSAFELNYLKNWDNHSLSSSIFYRYTDNVIQRVRYRAENSMETTFMNISQSKNVGAELIAKNRLFWFINLTTSVELFYNKIDSASFLTSYGNKENIAEQSGFSWNARMIGNFLITSTFSAQITGMYNSSRVIAQGKQEAGYSIDVGLRKSFFNRNLNVNLTVRDLLDSRRRKTNTSGEGFKQYSEFYWHGRTFGITVSYKFGNLGSRRNIRNNYQNGDSGMDLEMDSY